MINLHNRISLSNASKKKIKAFLRKNHGNLNGNSWDLINKSIKNELSGKLLYNQKFKCVYCERYLTGLYPQIDHFAPKSRYPSFCFNPSNLFYVCGFCNSSIKGKKNTVAIINDRYDKTTFRIVNPYRNNPNEEIKFSDEDRIDLDVPNCTYLGKKTIVFFEYHKTLMTNIRAKQLVYERLNPLLSEDERKLIHESIAYRKSK